MSNFPSSLYDILVSNNESLSYGNQLSWCQNGMMTNSEIANSDLLSDGYIKGAWSKNNNNNNNQHILPHENWDFGIRNFLITVVKC